MKYICSRTDNGSGEKPKLLSDNVFGSQGNLLPVYLMGGMFASSEAMLKFILEGKAGAKKLNATVLHGAKSMRKAKCRIRVIMVIYQCFGLSLQWFHYTTVQTFWSPDVCVEVHIAETESSFVPIFPLKVVLICLTTFSVRLPLHKPHTLKSHSINVPSNSKQSILPVGLQTR